MPILEVIHTAPGHDTPSALWALFEDPMPVRPGVGHSILHRYHGSPLGPAAFYPLATRAWLSGPLAAAVPALHMLRG